MGIYAIVKPSHRPLILCIGSCFIIAWASPLGLIPITASVLSGYLCGRICDKYRSSNVISSAALLLCTLVNLTAIVLFCISKSFGSEPFTAIGAGIYTLHSVSYAFDVKRGETEAQKSLMIVWAYIGFLPSLNSIPIVRYNEIKNDITEPKIRSDLLSNGILIMLLGISEKLIVSDRLTVLFNDILNASSGELSTIMSWIGALLYGAALFTRLKGYAHIAQGFAMMLGFKIENSFDYPYSQTSLQGFLNSYNISAVRFVHSYIARPISGTSSSMPRHLLATAVSMTVLCLSYNFSLNFLLWGVTASLMIIIEILAERRIEKIPKPIRYILTHILTLIGWGLISQRTIVSSVGYVRGMFSGSMLIDPKPFFYFLSTAMPYFLLLFVFEMPVFKKLYIGISKKNYTFTAAAKPFVTFALLILCTSFLMAGGSQSIFV